MTTSSGLIPQLFEGKTYIPVTAGDDHVHQWSFARSLDKETYVDRCTMCGIRVKVKREAKV